MFLGACLGLSNDWDCCTASSPCNIGEGDCDKDSECAAGLKCGQDNCRGFNPSAQSNADCCIPDPNYSSKSVCVNFIRCFNDKLFLIILRYINI